VLILEHQLTPHPLRQLSPDRKPQAEPDLTGRLAAALEALENELALVTWDPWPLVTHAQ
jgi:hypothetical protein